MDIHFNCTQCGRCCRNTKIPLTSAEAVGWLKGGNPVRIICEAWPWSEDAACSDEKVAYLRGRSFAAMSGAMPARVVATLVADIGAQCPNLLEDMRCGIYERRPLVCRIYPAEINPFRQIEPSMKACPPEAWSTELPRLMHNGTVVSAEIRRDIERWRGTLGPEIEVKHRLCAALKLGDAAVAHEGFLVYSPQSTVLLAALTAAMDDGAPAAESQWRLVTDRPESVEEFSHRGAVACYAGDLRGAAYQYIGLKRA